MSNVDKYYNDPDEFFREKVPLTPHQQRLSGKKVPLTPNQQRFIHNTAKLRRRNGQGIPPPQNPCLVHVIIEGHAKCNLGVSGIQAKANYRDPTGRLSGDEVLCKTHYDEVSQKGGRRTRKKIDKSSRRRRKSNVTRRSL